MTGPISAASWMDCHDIASSGRSEAWSELLGLRSNPRTSPGSMRPDGSSTMFQRTGTVHGIASVGLGLGLGLGAYGEDSTLGRTPWGEAGSSLGGGVSGRKSLDSIFGAVPETHSEGLKPACGTPRAGLKDLDPLFAVAATTNTSSSSGGGTGGLFQDPQGHLEARATMPRENPHHRPRGTLSPIASHPLLQSDAYPSRRPPLSPVNSQGTLSEQQTYGRPASLAGASPVGGGASAVLQHEVYRRAALDFVLELAGPEVPQAAGRECNAAASLLKADELPIPAFALDRDARVCMWNKQLAQLSGWGEEEMLRGQTTLASVLQPGSGNVARNRSCVEVARSVLFGAPPAEATFRLRRRDANSAHPDRACHSLGLSISAPALPGTFTRGTPTRKHGGRVPGEGSGHAASGPSPDCVTVSLRFSRRSDAVGSVCGVVCVVVPLPSSSSLPAAHRGEAAAAATAAAAAAGTCPSGCELCRTPGRSRRSEALLLAGSQGQMQKADVRGDDTPEKGTGSGGREGGSASGSLQANLFDHVPSSTSSSCSGVSTSDATLPHGCSSPPAGVRRADTYPAAASEPSVREAPGTPTAQGGHSLGLPGAVQGGAQVQLVGEGGGSVEDVRALVMDSVDAVRMELAQNLERCGVDVVTCSSLGEAIWRYERSLSDPAEGPAFDVIFLELQPHTEELFLAIRDLRRLEEEARIMGQVTCLDAVLPPPERAGSSARSQLSGSSTSSLLSFEGAGPGGEAAGGKLAISGSREGGHAQEGGRGGRQEEEEGEERIAGEVEEEEEEEGLRAMGVPEGQGEGLAEAEGVRATKATTEAEKRCLVLTMVNLNRWDLAGLDAAMEQCVRAGGDAVIPRSMPLQQLKTALRKLGIRSKYLMFPSRLPRALSGVLHNPLNLSR